ncbi:hypothetical protein TRFO_33444 [Tritrichomonas foetus]|uniref:Uncharacterized protein n=1 Tax=Tritrichomonas foetus TaxID=1144522 RepID=A0A1J4JLJ7_9EUKA|nr:hypothetical protein TRFO_33444 [Tritrichomonas foetus]|eukprot:OHS99984.1 hypothetical protein TRFO_33444 [Tritrichomonas foetus]
MNFYAQSFEYIENPWPLLDLLIKNNKKFLEIENSEDYISLLLFLNSHFANYVRARLKHCRPIFIRALRSENLRCVSASYLAIATLFDSGIDLPLSQVFNDLKEPELEENVLKVISLIKQIPIKQEYIYALINSAHRYEEASKTVLQLLKLETTALILIENSKWLKYLLPTISHTLKIYQKCIQYDSVKKKLKYCKEIPYFMIMLLHSNDISCLQQLPIVIRDSNLTNLEILQENNFFEVLLQEMNERNDILPYLAILSNIASIGYTKKYLKFTTILKNSLKSKDAMISHGALHALSNLSQYKQCAGQYREQNILDIAENYCNSKEDEKYLRRLREYI